MADTLPHTQCLFTVVVVVVVAVVVVVVLSLRGYFYSLKLFVHYFCLLLALNLQRMSRDKVCGRKEQGEKRV